MAGDDWECTNGTKARDVSWEKTLAKSGRGPCQGVYDAGRGAAC